jgi:hypothetical protein
MVFLLSRNAEYSGQHKPVEGPTVSFILIDGLLNSAFVSMLQEKQLPVIEQLIEDGIYVKEGISSFPTMTGYAFFPFVTGMDATNSDIYGLRWFDRNRSSGNLRNYVGRTNVAMNGGIRKDMLSVPYIISGPDIGKEVVPYALAEDIGAKFSIC